MLREFNKADVFHRFPGIQCKRGNCPLFQGRAVESNSAAVKMTTAV